MVAVCLNTWTATAFPPNHWVGSLTSGSNPSFPAQLFLTMFEFIIQLMIYFYVQRSSAFPSCERQVKPGVLTLSHVFFFGRKEKGTKKTIKSIKKFKGAAKSDFHSIFLPKSSVPALFPFRKLLHVFPFFAVLSCCLLFPPRVLEPSGLTK